MRLTSGGSLNDLGFDFANKCRICGEPPSAVWVGLGGATEVCQDCAVATLPALIADAVSVPRNNTVAYEQVLSKLTAAFWKAVAARIASEARDAR